MKILILGLNYAPEQVGIGPYTTGMAEMLAAAGHKVAVVVGKPYYPHWKVDPAYAGARPMRTVESGVDVTRCPIYVPANPSGVKRIFHHLSFASSAIPAMMARAWSMKPDVVMTVAPSLIAAPVARSAAKLCGAKFWLHIQDFEVEAAFATGLMDVQGAVARSARQFEQWSMAADRISTISPQMCAKLLEKGVPADRVVEFRNWASIDDIKPLTVPSSYRREWSIKHPHVALYSGNIANKQGIEIIVEAAELLRHRDDLLFAICGNGPNRARLVESAAHLGNIRFFDLQPMEKLSNLLGLASVHLLPQIAGAADLVLPSKLTNMLASGRPVVATASPGTGLEREVDNCGISVPPGDAHAFADAIETLLDDDLRRETLGRTARQRAEERWSKKNIIARFEEELQACVQVGAGTAVARQMRQNADERGIDQGW